MHTEHLNVTGMTCGGCTSKVTNALTAIAGVSDAKVSLADGEAVVRYDERVTAPEQLKAAVKGAGYGVESTNVAQKRQAKGGCCG
jgi:copper chaperone CopZ